MPLLRWPSLRQRPQRPPSLPCAWLVQPWLRTCLEEVPWTAGPRSCWKSSSLREAPLQLPWSLLPFRVCVIITLLGMDGTISSGRSPPFFLGRCCRGMLSCSYRRRRRPRGVLSCPPSAVAVPLAATGCLTRLDSCSPDASASASSLRPIRRSARARCDAALPKPCASFLYILPLRLMVFIESAW